MKRTIITLAAALLLAASLPVPGLAGVPCHLRCEFSENPLGIEELNPALSWKLDDPRSGAKQAAYRVIVAESQRVLAKNTGDLWDNEKVASDQSHLVVYGGESLSTLQQVYWKVKYRDQDGEESAWSEPASWEMGVLRKEDWAAQWIACADNPGCAKVRLTKAEGKPVIVRYGQALEPGRGRLYYPPDSQPAADGRKINRANCQEMLGGGKSMAASLFVPKAGADAVLENKFACFSFRYVEISGLGSALPNDQVAGVVVHSDLPLTGMFETSSDMLNRVYAACANTMIYCSHGVYQDNICQERGGYSVIRGQTLPAFNYLRDVPLFHSSTA
jgi:hypothetical protein